MSQLPETNQEDQRWVTRAREGDLAAFNLLVERYQRLAYNIALRMVRDPAAAEDVTQEAFFSAYRALARYRGGNVRSWLLAIVANGARDHLRSPHRRRSSSLEAITGEGDPDGPSASGEATPEQQALQSETGRMVHEALARLPENQRLLVTLVDLQGMDYEEAAEIAGIAVGTVKSRLSRGRERLRQILRPMMELSGDSPRQNG